MTCEHCGEADAAFEECLNIAIDKTELLSLVLARNLSVPRSLETARSLLTKAGGIKIVG